MITKDTVSFTLSFEGSSLIQYGDSSYSYNEAHIRIKKETPTQTTYYTLEGQNIIHTKVVTASLVEDTYYLYDELGILVGYTYNDNTYYYERDLLGNIIRIVDKDLKTIVEYKYDAFGNFTKELYTEVINAGTIEQQNHFYYKGYCLDKETGLYYCNSRYYDPSIGRWISPDDIGYLEYAVIGGSNLYVYCVNNPVMYTDPSGNFAVPLTVLGLIIGVVAGATAGGVIAYNVAKNNGAEGWELFGWTMAGIAGGGIIGGTLGVGAGALVTKITGIYGFSVTKYYILPIKQVTILGHKGYVATATSVGAGYYQIPDKLYEKLEQSGKHLQYNLQYLIDAHSLGSRFEIIPNRVVDSGSMLYYELQYLIEKGIAWIFGY